MNQEQDIVNCLRVLRDGGVILFPTDTIWGLGADATNEAAVKRIFDMKKRPEGKGLIILLADQRDIFRYVSAPAPELFDYLDNLRQPATVVLEGAIGLADPCIEADGSIGIRIVKDEFCRHLIKRFGKPVTATSANRSGEAAPSRFHEIDRYLIEKVDYTVHYRREETTAFAPSPVVRWNSDGTVTSLR